MAPGDYVATTGPGARIQARPDSSSEVVAILDTGAELRVAIGPLLIDGETWYFVTEPVTDLYYDLGWVTAGTLVDPSLALVPGPDGPRPYVGGWWGSGSAIVGPMSISDANFGLRWSAVGDDCEMSLAYVTANGTSRTVVEMEVPGFAIQTRNEDFRDVQGELMLDVHTGCIWAASLIDY